MIALLLSCSLLTGFSHKKHERAMKSFNQARFAEAAEQFRAELAEIAQEEPSAMGLVVREKLTLSLYQSGKVEEARAEFKRLRERYPDYRWNPHEVTEETIRDIEGPAAPAPAVATPPREIVATAPVVPEKRWHWYFLVPLGIGQFLAGSPVRGSLFLILELGFLAMNITGALLLQNEMNPDGTVRRQAQGQTAVVVMNVGFFGLISALLGGVIDGIFERK